MIACKSRATIVPTRVFGTYEAFGRHQKFPKFFGPIDIVYGTPISSETIDPGKEHPDRYLEASRRIMARIAALKLPKESTI